MSGKSRNVEANKTAPYCKSSLYVLKCIRANKPALTERDLMEAKHFTVSRIEGEYAYLLDTESGEELFIALALLPLGTDVGSVLCCENFEFFLEN